MIFNNFIFIDTLIVTYDMTHSHLNEHSKNLNQFTNLLRSGTEIDIIDFVIDNT